MFLMYFRTRLQLTNCSSNRILSVLFYAAERHDTAQVRAMPLYYCNFAFTYRFSFTGERAGETRAVNDTI